MPWRHGDWRVHFVVASSSRVAGRAVVATSVRAPPRHRGAAEEVSCRQAAIADGHRVAHTTPPPRHINPSKHGKPRSPPGSSKLRSPIVEMIRSGYRGYQRKASADSPVFDHGRGAVASSTSRWESRQAVAQYASIINAVRGPMKPEQGGRRRLSPRARRRHAHGGQLGEKCTAEQRCRRPPSWSGDIRQRRKICVEVSGRRGPLHRHMTPVAEYHDRRCRLLRPVASSPGGGLPTPLAAVQHKLIVRALSFARLACASPSCSGQERKRQNIRDPEVACVRNNAQSSGSERAVSPTAASASPRHGGVRLEISSSPRLPALRGKCSRSAGDSERIAPSRPRLGMTHRCRG